MPRFAREVALFALGFCCSKEDIGNVFNYLDEDGSGQIEYKEMQAILRGGPAAAPPAPPPTVPKRPGSGGAARPGSAAKKPGAPSAPNAPKGAPSPRAAKAAGK